MEKAVDWQQYFLGIAKQCPWSMSAFKNNQIDIVPWAGKILPLGHYRARIYMIDAEYDVLESLTESLDHSEYEWFYSYPGYGPYATPQSVIIQQNRSELEFLRNKLTTPNQS